MKNGSQQGQNEGSARRQKVLYLITKSNWGGAQRYVYDLVTHLPSTYERVVAFGPEGPSGEPGALAEKLRQAGIRTILIPELSRDIGPLDMKAFSAVRTLCAAERPDIVHLNSSKAGLIGALAARAARVPRVVFTAHGWPFRESRSRAWKAVAWLGSLATVLLAHRVICICTSDLGAFSRVPFVRRKQVLIYSGIDRSMAFGSGAIIRSAFPAGARITGTIGELTANKNQAALIEAARKDEGLSLAIVGEGEDRPLLERMVAAYGLGERVRFFGFLPAADVLKGFDRFALPSKKEGLPYVILEARLAGLPIEANRVGGVGEALDMPLDAFSVERMATETVAQCYR